MTRGQEAIDSGNGRKLLNFEVEVTGRNKLGDRFVEINCAGEKSNLVAKFGYFL